MISISEKLLWVYASKQVLQNWFDMRSNEFSIQYQRKRTCQFKVLPASLQAVRNAFVLSHCWSTVHTESIMISRLLPYTCWYLDKIKFKRGFRQGGRDAHGRAERTTSCLLEHECKAWGSRGPVYLWQVFPLWADKSRPGEVLRHRWVKREPGKPDLLLRSANSDTQTHCVTMPGAQSTPKHTCAVWE